MVRRLFKPQGLEPISLALNRVRYFVIWVLVGGTAWLYGERLMYVALAVLTVLPIVSYLLAVVGIMALKLKQELPDTILKGEVGRLNIEIINATRLPFGNVRFDFYGDDFAVEMQDEFMARVGTFKPIVKTILFKIHYRGKYEIGIKSMQVMDLTGLFRLNRKMNMNAEIVALPQIADMTGFPISSNLLTQAQSRYDIRDEDYSTISDIRPYLPTDSIKRVHWKLTAKRNEWLVKNYQSNALHQVTIILDGKRDDSANYKDQIITEDRMVAMSLGLARFCLRRGMPVEFITGEGHKITGNVPADFDAVYNTVARLQFEESPNLNPHAILNQSLNDASGYINAVIMTPRLDVSLYERIANAQNNGHYIAVIYFVPKRPDKDADRICRLLTESNGNIYRIEADDEAHALE